jgi:Cell Wall Hydrolase
MVDDLGDYDVDPVEGNPFGSMASSPNDFDVAPVDHDPFAGAGGTPAPDQFQLASRQPEATPSSAGGPPLDPGDRQDLIRTVYGEAAGEPALGQAAIAHAILNRVRAGGYGQGIAGVVHAPAAGVNPKFGYHEFSPWNTGRATEGNPVAQNLSPKDPAYARIGDIVDKSYSGLIPDPTHGATHYYGRMPRPPSWAPPLAALNKVRIGGTTFVGGAEGPGRAPIQTAGGYAGGGPVQMNADLQRRLAMITRPRHGFANGGDPDQPAPDDAAPAIMGHVAATPDPNQPMTARYLETRPQGSIAPYDPSWGERIQQGVSEAGQALGQPAQGAERLGEAVRTGAEMVPISGNILSGNEAYRDVQSGNYGSAALSTLAAFPIPGATAEEGATRSVLRHADEAFPEGRIATAVPSNKALVDSAHASNDRTISLDTMRADPVMYGKTADLIRSMPDIQLPPNATDDEVHQAFIAHAKSNILALHDAVPDDIRGGSQQWYDGANQIAGDRAQRFNRPLENVAGVYAALSPKMDWFKNVSLGDRLMDIMHNQKWSGFTPEMDAWVANRYGGSQVPADVKAATAYANLKAKMGQGQMLGDLSDPIEQAHFVRAYDEAHNPRGYNIVNPDGSFAGPAMTGKGEEGEVGWAGFNAMANAIKSFNAQDMTTVSKAMGDRHKVRSFYNNIVAPNSLAGDVTADTHAIAASHLRPFSLADEEVTNGLGSTGPKSGETGAKGLYGLYADAYRQAAAERGILPRQMQSITWEALRGLWTPAEKRSASIKQGVEDSWNAYGGRNGLTLPQVQQRLIGTPSRIRAPSWHTGAAGEELEP